MTTCRAGYAPSPSCRSSWESCVVTGGLGGPVVGSTPTSASASVASGLVPVTCWGSPICPTSAAAGDWDCLGSSVESPPSPSQVAVRGSADAIGTASTSGMNPTRSMSLLARTGSRTAWAPLTGSRNCLGRSRNISKDTARDTRNTPDQNHAKENLLSNQRTSARRAWSTRNDINRKEKNSVV